MELQIPIIIKWRQFNPQRSVAVYKNGFWEIDHHVVSADFPEEDMLSTAAAEHRLVVDRDSQVIANYPGPRDAAVFALFPGPMGFNFKRKYALKEPR